PNPKTRGTRFGRTVSNVAVYQGLVIAPDYGGLVHCLDARTGEEYWAHDTRSAILSSPLIVDSKIYVSTQEDVWVFELGKRKKVLAQIEAPNGALCSPIFAHGTLYLTTRDRLYAIAGTAKNPAEASGGH